MKRFRALSGILAIAVALAIHVQAQFTFTTNNGGIIITGYTGSGGTVTIPSQTNGFPVTSIGEYAFVGCTNLAEIIIPDSIVSIGNYAFDSCSGLTSFTVASGVTNIGDGGFYYCTSLTNILISDSVASIGTNAFWGCSSLIAIAVNPANLAYSSVDGVLLDKSQTTLVQYPNGRVGSYVIPDTVTSIGESGFADCLGLTNVNMGSSVTNVGAYAFSSSDSLLAITVDPGNAFYSSVDGVLFDKSQTTLIQYPEGTVGSYTVPDGVTSIANNGFAESFSLTSITIGNSVTNIGDYAFIFCSRLTGVTIGNSVARIGDDAFDSCADLTNIVIPDSVITIGDGAFEGCRGLTNITIGTSVSAIGNSSFDYCTSLTDVIIPASVANIGNFAFANCSSLTGYFFQGNAPSVGYLPFLTNPNATAYYLPGTSGWSPLFHGLRTVLWNPQARTTDGHLGVRGNEFGFTITGTANIPLVVEASTSLANPLWMPLQNCTLTNGSIYFSDPQWTNYPSRFYRIRSP